MVQGCSATHARHTTQPDRAPESKLAAGAIAQGRPHLLGLAGCQQVLSRHRLQHIGQHGCSRHLSRKGRAKECEGGCMEELSGGAVFSLTSFVDAAYTTRVRSLALSHRHNQQPGSPGPARHTLRSCAPALRPA